MDGYVIAGTALSLILLAFGAHAELNGRHIRLETGEDACVYTPVEMDIETDEAPAYIVVVNEQTDTRYPATLRDGKLVFIVDALDANATVQLILTTGERPEDAPPRVAVSRQPGEDILDVLIDGVLFTRYHYGNQWRKPFLWPLNSEGGVGITRDYPMETESTPRIARDHPHHKSFWSAYGEVNGHDLWAEGSSAGNQRSGQVTFGSGDAYGWIRAENVWEDKDGNPLLDEIREYRFYATPETARLFDAHVTLKASHGEVLLSDTKEGGIVSARMRPDISHARAVITNAHGDQGEGTAWGKPSPWCDFSGDVPDIGWRGLAIFDHPGNFRHPSSWHVRNYGLMGANAFGYSYFLERDYNKGLMPENGDHTLVAGEALPFAYRIYVHSGDVEEASVAARYADYAAPPKAQAAD